MTKDPYVFYFFFSPDESDNEGDLEAHILLAVGVGGGRMGKLRAHGIVACRAETLLSDKAVCIARLWLSFFLQRG